MMCPSCQADNAESNRFCCACGAPLVSGSMLPTVAMAARAPSFSSAVDEGRFLPGTLLGERYRIIGLVGRGGMGEVYRATDLKLGQRVALKFLSESSFYDGRARTRFHDEVRIARQVSHPNVCRVYDIGEVDGQLYLSMEYVDGEDLSSLLRRIGRLPADKATEIARHLCAGLAAAHDKGVLHRDLKPANVMIDGRGNVLITDFGLAGLAQQLVGAEVRSGTPAYIAPEQLAGKEVSVRSDIYSLGLVLYEMFTGKRADRARPESVPTSLSAIVQDLDPALERVILRCLQTDPRQRPASALAVAAALPGGDPLAAALAAGETPSPEMVAAAGETEGMRVGWAVACLAAVLAGLVLCLWLEPGLKLTGHASLDYPPEALALRAREYLERFGYTDRGKDRAHGFLYDTRDFVPYLKQHDPSPKRWQHIDGQPALIRFWYRQAPEHLVATSWESSAMSVGEVTDSEPPRSYIPGSIEVELDPLGRLVHLEVRPQDLEGAQPPPPHAAEWSALFTAAGLDLARFASAEAQRTPPVACDARSAWTGVFPDAPKYSLRVEAASWRGRPVYFDMMGPWTRPAGSSPTTVRFIIQTTMFSIMIIAGVWLARYNARRGRGDRKGAARIALLVFALWIAVWVLLGAHVLHMTEFSMLSFAASSALMNAAIVWVSYMALEPFVRRQWPQALIGWSRVLAGSCRDPLVGRDLLAGSAAGVFLAFIFCLRDFSVQRAGAPPALRALENLLGATHLTGLAVYGTSQVMMGALVTFLLLFLLRLALRREWLAVAVFTSVFVLGHLVGLAIYGTTQVLLGTLSSFLLLCLLRLALRRERLSVGVFTAVLVLGTISQVVQLGGNLTIDVPLSTLLYAAFALIILRFGLLQMAAAMWVQRTISDFIVTNDFSAWCAGSTVFGLAIVLAMAGYGFHTTLAGRPLFKSDLLKD
jgi:Protein kinase domain